MGKQASQRVARIVYSQGQRKAMPIAHALQESRNVKSHPAPTTYHARNGGVVVRNPCVSVALQLYLYIWKIPATTRLSPPTKYSHLPELHRLLLSVARAKGKYARQPRVLLWSDGAKRNGRINLVNHAEPKEVGHHIADLQNVLAVRHHVHAQKWARANTAPR